MNKILSIFVFTLMTTVLTSQVVKTVNVTTAGNLTNMLSAIEKNSVTNLTITGNIDARDFVTIRDFIPNLTMLDIKDVSINAYEGVDGTSNNSVIYQLNEIPKFSFLNPVTYAKNTSLSTLILPYSCTSIDGAAFKDCVNLQNITIPNSVTFIGQYAFQNCTSLSIISIPNSIKSISNWAFENCIGLTNIFIPNGVIEDKAFYNCTGLLTVTIGDSASWIGNYAFYNCNKLATVKIGNSVTSIRYNAFDSCTKLSNLTIGNGVTSIAQCAFNNCVSLINVVIPNSVIIISNDAFSYCNGLTDLTLGSNVEYIGDAAFYGCNKLKTIFSLNTTPPTLASNCFPNTVTDVYLQSDVSVENYKSNINWYSYFPGSIIKKTISTSITNQKRHNVKVYRTNSGIVVEGTSVGETVTLYTVNGRQIQTVISKGERLNLQVDRDAVYLVKTGEKTFKVIL